MTNKTIPGGRWAGRRAAAVSYTHLFPITMYREKSRQKPKPEDAGDDYKPEYETYTELDTLNSCLLYTSRCV